MLPSILRAARRLVAGSLRSGGIAVDATAGRGRDTLFLARWVGPQGKVFAFDLQPAAIEETAQRLQTARLAERVRLIAQGHETLGAYLETIDAAMFNLGYLPLSDKSVVTQTETTLLALDQCLERLSHRGIITVVAYPGHTGGDVETAAVEQWFQDHARFRQRVACYRFLTRSGTCPILFALERGSGSRRGR